MSNSAAIVRTAHRTRSDRDAFLAQLRERLERMWWQRIDKVAELTIRACDLRAAGDQSAGAKGRTSAMLTNTERQLLQARRDLGESDAALGRFAEGTYGLCGHCGGSIEPERLEELPAAWLCAVCELWPQRP